MIEGYLAAVGAILFYGSYIVPLKFVKEDIHPILIQFYSAVSVCILSWFVLIYNNLPTDFQTIAAGAISAWIWVLGNSLSLVAIQKIGMASSVSIWAGLSIITSFVWGQSVFPDVNEITDIKIAITGLGFLSIGVCGIALCLKNKQDDDIDISYSVYVHPKNTKKMMIGIVCAVMMGLLNGSLFVPLQFLIVSNDHVGRVVFLIPFGVVSLLLSSGFGTIFYFVKKPLIDKGIALKCLLSGVFWFVGTFCSIYAIIFLGISIGFPLTQAALIVCTIWGFVFKEIKGRKSIIVWIFSFMFILAGIILLAISR